MQWPLVAYYRSLVFELHLPKVWGVGGYIRSGFWNYQISSLHLQFSGTRKCACLVAEFIIVALASYSLGLGWIGYIQVLAAALPLLH